MLNEHIGWLCEHKFHTIRPGLVRIVRLLQRLGNPHKTYPTVHIAGTNGKGSTCAILSTLLSAHGLKTGLYTSPHLIRLNERFRINGNEISDAQLADLLGFLRSLIGDISITYFEITTALAFLYFAKEEVDIAVIETGMGGRLDATNVIQPEVAVITTIGYDHMKYLGDTLEKIAFEKAGIIKRGRPVVIGNIDPGPLKVIIDRARALQAPEYVYQRDFSVEREGPFWTYRGTYFFSALDLALQGEYQGHNLALALRSLEILEEKGLLKIDENILRSALKEVEWEGRYKKIQIGEKLLLLDSAHNLQGVSALLHSLEKEKFLPYLLLLGLTDEEGTKPKLTILESLSKFAEKIIISDFLSPRKPVTKAEWSELLKNHPLRDKVTITSNPDEALRLALSQPTDKILITGSIYFLGEVLKSLKARKYSDV